MTSVRTQESLSVRATRLGRAAQLAVDAAVDAMVITGGADCRYLLGAGGESFERLTCLVLPAGQDCEPTLVVPSLEAPGYADLPLAELGIQLVTWTDGQDPYRLVVHAATGAQAPRRLALADTMAARHVLALRAALPAAEQVLASPILRELRMIKDAAEIAALRTAAHAIDRVHARMGEWLSVGRTEAEIGADIAAAIVAEGHTEAAFVIVGSGPNGASPHHAVSDRIIEAGDVVVVDIGGPVAAGYNSDCTRTYVIGEPRHAEVASSYAALMAAQEASVQAVRPGVSAEEVDAAGRRVLIDAGLGEYFTHRTGHGIGLDVHEEPYIVAGNTLALRSGMAFSVEPGIYLPGRWGARIEDIVVVTDTGVERLNNRPRDLVVLPV